MQLRVKSGINKATNLNSKLIDPVNLALISAGTGTGGTKGDDPRAMVINFSPTEENEKEGTIGSLGDITP